MHAPFSASRLTFHPCVHTKRIARLGQPELDDLLFCYYRSIESRTKARNDRGVNPEAFELIRLLILSSLPINRTLICPGRILTDLKRVL